jgi:hypothetical protein
MDQATVDIAQEPEFDEQDTDKALIEIELELAKYIDIHFGAASASLVSDGLVEEEDLALFVKRIVEDIIFGPLQEVFGGEEIIEAIQHKKALAFSTAFLDIALKIIEKAIAENMELESETYKDYRDFFSISILSFAINDSNVPKAILNAFLPDSKFLDLRERTLHDTLISFYFNEMKDESSGALALPLYFERKFSTENGNEAELLWTIPPQIDTIFKY